MKKVILVLMVAFVCASGAQAADPAIAELQEQLKQLSAKIAELEKQQSEKIAQIEEKQMEMPDWVATTKLKGDFRYRYENLDMSGTDVGGNRQRVRARLGLYGTVNDYIDYGVRFVAGGGATSGNQTLGDDFDSTAAKFDLYYVDVHPEQLKGAHVLLGKMKKPWLGRTGLIWDGDLNPEGIAIAYSKDLNDNSTFHANAGAFIVNDEDAAGKKGGDDARLQAVQVAVDTKVGDAKIQVGVSDYWFENMENSTANGANNNTPGSGFNIVEGFGSVSTKVEDLPVKVYGQIAQNTEALTSDDSAFLVGLKLGKAKNPGSWEVGYNYRDIGKDAVVGAFNDSDFNYGNTDSKGHAFGAKYQIAKNWQAGATYLMSEGTTAKKGDVDTLQLDLNFKF